MGKKRFATRFLKGFAEILAPQAETDTRLAPFVCELEGALKGRIGRSPGPQPELPLLNEVGPLVERATADGEMFRDLLMTTQAHVQWYAAYQSNGPAAALADRVLAAQVVGPNGLLKSDNVTTGFFLLGAKTDYPLHDHLADELYYVVSGSVRIQNGFDTSPRTVDAGGYSVTPSGMPHRLTTGDDPVLILYAWTGAVACDVWWWEHVEGEQWRRFAPTRTFGPNRHGGVGKGVPVSDGRPLNATPSPYKRKP